MNKKILYLIISIISISLIYTGYIFLKKDTGIEKKKMTYAGYSTDERKNDRSIIDGSPASEMELFAAIARLGRIKDESVLKKIISMYPEAGPNIKKVIIESIGHYNDPNSTEFLINIIEGSDNKNRYLALKAFANSSSFKNSLHLKKINIYLASEDKYSKRERIYLYSSAYKLETQVGTKRKYLLKLSQLISQLSSPYLDEAIFELLKARPIPKEILVNIRKIVIDGEGSTSLGAVIRYLSTEDKKWTQENIEKLIKGRNLNARIAVIQSLQFICPSKFWIFLDDYLNWEKNKAPLKLLMQQIHLYKKEDASLFIERHETKIVEVLSRNFYNKLLEKTKSAKQQNYSCSQ